MARRDTAAQRRTWIDRLEEGWRREYPDTDIRGLPPLVRLARLGLLIEQLQQETTAPYDMTPADYTVLAALRRVGPPYRESPSNLYNVLRRSSGGMTKMLKRLEKLGLIERLPDPNDGRGSLVALTKEGIATQERIFNELVSRSTGLLEGLPEKQIDRIDRALRDLLDAFERNFRPDGESR